MDGVNEDRVLQLLYDEPSETLVAHFERKIGPQPVKSIYTRHRTETTYQKVPCGDEYSCASSPVCAAKASLLFFIVMEPNRQGEPPWGSNAGRLVRHDLATRETTVVIDVEAFGMRHGGAWFSKLLSSSDDGSTLICVLARYSEPLATAVGSVEVTYFIARLDPVAADFEPLAPLSNSWF